VRVCAVCQMSHVRGLVLADPLSTVELYLRIYIYIYIHIYININIYIYIYLYISIRIYIYICVCVYIYVYVYVHVHVHVYVYVYVYIYSILRRAEGSGAGHGIVVGLCGVRGEASRIHCLPTNSGKGANGPGMRPRGSTLRQSRRAHPRRTTRRMRDPLST
jgi:hypothetical protein